jgi:hypothetical protein
MMLKICFLDSGDAVPPSLQITAKMENRERLMHVKPIGANNVRTENREGRRPRRPKKRLTIKLRQAKSTLDNKDY